MIIIAEVSELTRKIKLPTDRVLSVNGDYQVDGIAFKLPATYEGDLDFSTAAARVHWTGVDKVEHTNLITEEDGNGYPLWVMPSELTQGGHGVIEFAVSFVATDETAAVTKRWISDPVSFRNRRTVNGSNEDEEAEEETTYDRLASAIEAVRAAQASVDEVNEVLAGITNSSPVVVATVADLSGLDVTKHQLAIVRADGYLYYYDGTAWQKGIKYGSYELDTTLTESGKAADAAAVGAEVSAIKEDLSAAKVDAKIVYGETELHPNLYPTIGYTINSNNLWQSSSYVKCALIPVSKNAEYTFINKNVAEGYIAFVKDAWVSQYGQPHWATGETGRIIISANGGEYKAIPPEDAEIIVVQLIDRYSNNVTPDITVKEVVSTAKTINDDMMWSWWIYPTMQSFSKIRDKLYWTFTSATGDAGIASYDYRSKVTKRTVLNHVDDVDDHTGIAMKVLASGKIICAYSTGHNTDNFMHVRVSKIAEDISDFEEPVNLESSEDGNTTYAQLFTYAATGQKGKIYLFYRAASGHTWACRISADYGATWGEEIPIITSENQYYCHFTETTTRGVLRVCMMSNPNADDRSIRQAFLHLATMEVYDSDNSTLLGTTNVDCTRVSVLIGLTSGYDTQRLFDVAITDISAPKILYAPFNLSESSDSVYKLYNNGSTITICNGGMSLWNPKYQLGACFKGTNEILVARNDDGVDCIEKYGDDGTLKKTVYRELVTDNLRNFRPVADTKGKAWAYLRGYYNPESFKDFNADAVLMAYD